MKRLAINSVLTLWIAISLTFFLIRQMPGDVVHQWALRVQTLQGIDYPQAREQVKVMLNFQADQTAWSQYVHYVGGVLQGNLGVSLAYQIPVTEVIAAALPWTALIAFGAVSLSFLMGTALGLFAAWKRQTRWPEILRAYATVSQAIPDFLVGLLLIAVLAIKLPIFPMRGAYSTFVEPGFNLAFFGDVFYHACLPILAFAVPMTADWALGAFAAASSVREELFLTSAAAQGLSVRRILVSYLGPNALLPLIPGLASSFAGVLGGVVLVEAVFGYPGIGLFLSESIQLRDFPLIQGIFLVTTAATIAANLVGDFLARKLDPRIAKEGV